MALGPGKYDDLVTEVRTQTQAEGVLLFTPFTTRREAGSRRSCRSS